MKKLTLVLFASLFFFTTASYAENEELTAKVAEAKSKLNALQDSNVDFKKRLENNENKIMGWRLALENIEADIAKIKKGEEQIPDKGL